MWEGEERLTIQHTQTPSSFPFVATFGHTIFSGSSAVVTEGIVEVTEERKFVFSDDEETPRGICSRVRESLCKELGDDENAFEGVRVLEDWFRSSLEG